jgi:hypothetical protein
MQALPPDNQPLSLANASKLSKWICEGPKGNGIDSKLDALLQRSHTLILWAAAACRVVKNNLFTTDFGGDSGCAGSMSTQGIEPKCACFLL